MCDNTNITIKDLSNLEKINNNHSGKKDNLLNNPNANQTKETDNQIPTNVTTLSDINARANQIYQNEIQEIYNRQNSN